MIALGCRWPILAVLRTICGLCADWGRRSSRLGHCPDDGTRPHTHRSLSDYGPPEGRCASLRDGPAAHPSPGSVQPGDGAGYEEAEEWDVMTAPHGVDAIEPEKRAKPRPGGRGLRLALDERWAQVSGACLLAPARSPWRSRRPPCAPLGRCSGCVRGSALSTDEP